MALVYFWLLLSTVYNVSGWPTASFATKSSRDGAQDSSVESNSTVVSPGLHLAKRFEDARFTFFDAGLGACGWRNVGSDFIVALNDVQWNNGKHCKQWITIRYQDKSTEAQIMDECPGCPVNALDLTRGLFDYFASEDKGVIYGSWDFSSGGGSRSAPPPPPRSTATPETTIRPLASAKVSLSFPQSDSPSESPTESPTSPKTTTHRLVTAEVSPSFPQSEYPSEIPPPPPPPTKTPTTRCLRRRS